MEKVYLDHNSTTPVDPEVVEAMLPYLSGDFGNASSVHLYGRDAKVVLENAREKIASILNCQPSELYFTSGGTESDNIAVLGTAFQMSPEKKHLVVGATEHHAVLEPAEFLRRRQGFTLDLLPVDREGLSLSEKLEGLINDNTALVSVMHANNETGTIHDVKTLAEISHRRGVLFHTDAVQSVGKIEVDVKELGVDMLSLTAHKVYGPKGIGAIFIKQGVKIAPLFYGGQHEKGRRPGTENIVGVVGLAKTLELAEKRREEDSLRLKKLSDYFIDAVLAKIPDVYFNGSRERRIPQTVNLSFKGVEGESIILSLDMKNIAVSSGSACTSGVTEPSHVLMAMGIPAVVSQGSVRFSMGHVTTREQLDYVLAELPPVIEHLRSMSPVYNQ